MRFDGKTVIVTGSGAGLGRAYVHLFSKLGANVVVNDVSEKAANAVVDEVKKGMAYKHKNVSLISLKVCSWREGDCGRLFCGRRRSYCQSCS